MCAHQRFVLLHVYGPFEATWRKHGFEATLMGLALRPSLLQDMFEAHTDLVIGTLEKARAYGVVPDGLFLVEDLGINTGPMFAPRHYDALLFPAHKRLGDYLHRAGITYFVHSDGDIRQLIPRLIAAGIEVLQPMEAKIGLDVRALKREYGRDLSFMGNIDATRMAGDPQALEAEIRDRITTARRVYLSLRSLRTARCQLGPLSVGDRACQTLRNLQVNPFDRSTFLERSTSK